jgi:uncharacterized membrane protein YkoI
MSKSQKTAIAVAAVAALGLGGSALANAATQSATPTATPNAKDSRPAGGPGNGEIALTGDTADKVKAAVLAKVPGTVLRVETDNGSVYEAHIKKADGTEVVVKVDKNFAVTATEEHTGGRGGHEHGGGPGNGEKALTGDTAEKGRRHWPRFPAACCASKPTTAASTRPISRRPTAPKSR